MREENNMAELSIFKRCLIRLKSYFVELLIIFPFFNIKVSQLFRGIDDNGALHNRSRLLKKYSNLLAKIMIEMHFNHDILISGKGKVYTVSDGIYLNNQLTDRYFFAVLKGIDGNEGKGLLKFLTQKNIQVNQMIDIGAGFGEITLYFSKMLPEAKILSIEASPENYAVFKDNLNNQMFPVDNITLVNEAVADRKGSVQMTGGLGAENSIILDHGKNPAEKMSKVWVRSDTLSNIMKRFNFDNVDFLKIDIEGAEPLLYECLEMNLAKIKSVYCEFSYKNSKDEYIRLSELFFDNGMSCFDTKGNELQSNEVKDRISQENVLMNLWFINLYASI